jgi:hypothetical protein
MPKTYAVPAPTAAQHRVLRITLLALAIVAVWAAAAAAQPGPGGGPQGWGPGAMMGPGMMGGRGFNFMCNPRSAGLAEWRLDQIEQSVRPNEAQKAKLTELRAASTKAAESLTAACAGDVPSKATERLAQMEKRVDALLLSLKTVRPAFDAFYESLDADQRARMDAIGPRRWGWMNWRWRWE